MLRERRCLRKKSLNFGCAWDARIISLFSILSIDVPSRVATTVAMRTR